MAARATWACQTLVGTGKSGKLKVDAQGYYNEVPLGALEYRNCDGDIYTLSSARKLIEESNDSKLQASLKMGVLRGEYGHPRLEQGESKSAFIVRACGINEKNVSHHIRSVHIDVDNVKDEKGNSIAAILGSIRPCGPYGDTLAEQMENAQENVCFSVRAWSDDYEGKGGIIHKDIRDIVTWDYVNRPGLNPAQKYLSPSLESFEKITFTREHMQTALNTLKELGMSMESDSAFGIRSALTAFGWGIAEDEKRKNGSILILPPSAKWI